jgi:hypothetical protein
VGSHSTPLKKVFISHNTKEDSRFAHRLAEDLNRLGAQIWIAPDCIDPGEGWVDAINRGLSESSHMLVVLTPAAMGSKWVRMETNTAITLEREGRMEVIPLDVAPCDVPQIWRQYQMIPFRQDYDAGLRRLAKVLSLRLTPSEPVQRPRRRSQPVTAQEVERSPDSARQPFEREEEHVRILRRGVVFWNQWRRENPDTQPNLRGAELGTADLARATLIGADLSEANLFRANLSGATLGGAILVGANLSRATLTDADLTRADLTDACLVGADLTGASLMWAKLKHTLYSATTRWPTGITPPLDAFEVKSD